MTSITSNVAEWTFRWVRNAPVHPHRGYLLHQVLCACRVDGLFCEFGVYRGESLRYIAERITPHEVHGFDSFLGLPKQDPEFRRDGWPVGAFRAPIPEGLPKNANLHIGWFEDTLPPFVKTHSGPASFIHCDADLYSSTKTILDNMESKIVRGTVILFDEFLWWDGWDTKGEARAWAEFIERTGKRFECVGTREYGEQVAVRILN